MQSTILAKGTGGGGLDFASSTKGRIDAATWTFLAMCVVMMAATVYTAFNLSAVVSYTRDIWHHLAVYRELIASPFDAANPHVATDDPSRSYSPWTVFVAILARSLGLDAFGAIAISAILSSLSILVGIFLFSRAYTRHPWAPALMVVIFFGSWLVFVNHTGYHTVATFLYSAAYPFAIVLGGGLILWWGVLRGLDAARLSPLALLVFALVSAALFVTHQLQGLFAVGGALGFALFAAQSSLTRRAMIAASLLAGLYLSQYWWYFDPVAFVLDPQVRGGHTAPRMLEYSLADLPEILGKLGLALFGLLGLINARSGRFRLELVLPLAVLGLGFIFLLVTDNWISVRIVPFLALYLQIALLALLLPDQRVRDMPPMSQIWRTGFVVILCAGLVNNIYMGHETYNKSRTFLLTGSIEKHYMTWSKDILAASAYAETLAPEGATVIAHHETAFPMEAHWFKVVAIPRLFAEVPDMLERQANNRAFFDPSTTIQERCAILAKYDVQMIVYRDVLLDDLVEVQLAPFGERKPYADLSFIPARDGQFAVCNS